MHPKTAEVVDCNDDKAKFSRCLQIYAQNAIRKKNEALNYMRLGSRLDAVVSRLDTQAKMQVCIVQRCKCDSLARWMHLTVCAVCACIGACACICYDCFSKLPCP